MSQHGCCGSAWFCHFKATRAQVVGQSLKGGIVYIAQNATQIVRPVGLDGARKQAVGDMAQIGVAGHTAVRVALDVGLNLKHTRICAAVDMSLEQRAHHATAVAGILAVYVQAAYNIAYHCPSIGHAYKARLTVLGHQCSLDGEVFHGSAIKRPNEALALGCGFIMVVRDCVSLTVQDTTEWHQCVADRCETGATEVNVCRNHSLGRRESPVHHSCKINQVECIPNLIDSVRLFQCTCALHACHTKTGYSQCITFLHTNNFFG